MGFGGVFLWWIAEQFILETNLVPRATPIPTCILGGWVGAAVGVLVAAIRVTIHLARGDDKTEGP